MENYIPYIVSICIFILSMSTLIITKYTTPNLNNFSLGIICGLSLFHLLPDSDVNIFTLILFYLGYSFGSYFQELEKLNQDFFKYKILYIEISLIFHSFIIGLNYTNYIYGIAIGFHQMFETISVNSIDIIESPVLGESLLQQKKESHITRRQFIRTFLLSITIPIGIILRTENIENINSSYLNMFISGSLLSQSYRNNIYNQIGIFVMLGLGFVA